MAEIYKMDLLEHKSVTNVIVLRTVLDQVKERSLPLYHRLRAACAEPDKHFYVFSNEYHR